MKFSTSFATALLLLFILSTLTTAQPKREFRGAWLTTVVNLDWPSSGNDPVDVQKADLLELLDGLQSLNINAVLFQIRTECDALYDSEIEPWSVYLTGASGREPQPYWDPLEFVIEETHKRGMELHAWMNPYRAERVVDGYPLDETHVVKEHPEWTLVVDDYRFLNPGLPEVREYVTTVVLDVVTRYDVDGIHFDDYFYPYTPIQSEDYPAAREHCTDCFDGNNLPIGSRIADWRRDNVNRLMSMVNSAIKMTKPHVRFGISPFGIWKDGVPSGISGFDAYSVLYADPIAWLNQGSIDYLTPQLYWPFGGGQDYGKLMPWWAERAANAGRHCYPGLAAYRIETSDWPSSYIQDQVNANRFNANVQGEVYFRVLAGLLDNPKGFADILRRQLYQYPALPPTIEFLDNTPPNKPTGAAYAALEDGLGGLSWTPPGAASDGENARRYIIYRFTETPAGSAPYENPANILGLTSETEYVPESPENTGSPYYYVVKALDANNNESASSELITVSAPAAPQLASPVNGADGQPQGVALQWNVNPEAAFYELHVARDAEFASLFLVADELRAGEYAMNNLQGETTYYWRVLAQNPGGTSEFSDTYSFTTGFPAAPVLAAPTYDQQDLETSVTLAWHKSKVDASYDIQLGRSITFNELYTDFDTSGITDTSHTFHGLRTNTLYFWRVRAVNEFGESNWSSVFRFRTGNVVGVEDEEISPDDFALMQNYPNPFNPTTMIQFQLPIATQVRLRVFDVYGRLVRTLEEGYLPAGRYTVEWDGTRDDGRRVSSGMYIYKLTANGFVDSKKMLFIK